MNAHSRWIVNRHRRLLLLTLWIAALLVEPSSAFAGETVEVVGADGTSWSRVVRGLPEALDSQGTEVRVVAVREHGGRLQCGHYSLELGDVTTAAFTLGGCDPTTDSTSLVLMDRSALFDHDLPVSIPRDAPIAARVTGAASVCRAEVHPLIVDIERGVQVPATPGLFRLRPDSGATAREIAGGCVIESDHLTDTPVGSGITDASGDGVAAAAVVIGSQIPIAGAIITAAGNRAIHRATASRTQRPTFALAPLTPSVDAAHAAGEAFVVRF